MEELRNKLIKNKEELRKSVKESSAINTGKMLNIIADLIELTECTLNNIPGKLEEFEDQEKKENQLKIPEELKKYIHKTKTNKDSIDLITMSIEKILNLNLKVDIESFCVQIIRTLNKEQKIVFNHIIEENKRNDFAKEAILNYIKFIDDIRTFCINCIRELDSINTKSVFCDGQLFAFKQILSMIKKQESEAKNGSKSK